ncbi:MAG: HipA domain-containing protein, partial [Verrucomicrobiae bacterium]|nr:HipA domain-containing protein [Verrucomicrobiae bacterium]
DEENHRWGMPKGATPTTHILKPNTGGFAAYELNEHFCLRLAGRIGLASAKSWTKIIAGIPVIIVERFDRVRRPDRVLRVHQEDMCQALARMPDRKYQSEGGPSTQEIFNLIRNHSAQPQEDVLRFLDAMIFNFLIGGTDAHAKNFGFLLAGGGQVRLTRLYDLSSSLPYPKEIPPLKARLAMKIGGQYFLYRIGPKEWEKAAAEWKLDRDMVVGRLLEHTLRLPEAAIEVSQEMSSSGDAGIDPVIERLVAEISKSAESVRKVFS